MDRTRNTHMNLIREVPKCSKCKSLDVEKLSGEWEGHRCRKCGHENKKPGPFHPDNLRSTAWNKGGPNEYFKEF